MRDIERELRALGERAAAETTHTPSAPQKMLRRIRAMRFLTAGLAVLVLLAVVGGGTLAARSLSTTPEVLPAEDPEVPVEDPFSQEEPVVLASSLETGRVTLTFDLAAEGVCYGGDLRGLERMEVMTRGGDTVLSLFPADDEFSDYGYLCANNLPADVMRGVISSPEDFELFSVTEGVEHLAGLADLQAAPARRCSSVRFEPTYLPEGWTPDLQRVPTVEAQDGRKRLGFYGPPGDTDEERPNGSVDLTVESGPVAPQQDGDLEVLGAETTFVPGDTGHGSFITFGFEGCTYTLESTGIEDEEFIRFAEGLRPQAARSAGLDDGPANFRAIWPEDDGQGAKETCTEDPELFTDPESVALEFALAVLGWDEAASFDVGGREAGYEIRRSAGDDGSEAEGPAVHVFMTEALRDCWFVGSVDPVTDGDPNETGSMSLRGRDVFMRFDKRGADSVTHEVGYGGEITRYEWTHGDPQNVEFKLDFDPEGTGHFLLLYRDANGEVIGAQGSGLPEGDFAAG